MRKKGSILLCITMLIFIAAAFPACTKDENSTNSKPVEQLKGNIVLYCFHEDANALKYSADNFKKKYPQVNIQVIEKTDDAVNNYIINSWDNETVPDAIQVRDENVKFYLDNFKNKFASIQDTSGYYSENYVKYRVKNLSINSKTYGFPFDNNPYVMFYRKDLLESQGIDMEDIKTWKDYTDMCKKLNQISAFKGLPLYQGSYNKIYRLLFSQIGDSYFNKDGDLSLDTAKTENVFTLMRNFKLNGVFYQVNNNSDLIAKIKSGLIWMIPAPSNFMGELKTLVPELNGKWAVTKLPAFENGGNRDAFLDSSSFMVTSNSKNKKLFSEFMKYIISNKQNSVKLVSSYGVICGNNSMYEDASFESKDTYFSKGRITDIFLNILDGINEPYYSKNFPLTNDIVNREVGNIINSTTDISKDITDINKDVNDKVK